MRDDGRTQEEINEKLSDEVHSVRQTRMNTGVKAALESDYTVSPSD